MDRLGTTRIPSLAALGRVAQSDATGFLTWVTPLVVAVKTANYTLTLADDLILADCAAGPITLTLPAVAGRVRPYYVKKTDIGVNAVIIDGNGSEVIDDQLTFSFNDLYGAYMVVPGNGKWWVF